MAQLKDTTINGSLNVTGVTNLQNEVYIPNNYQIWSYNTNGDARNILQLNSNNNTVLGYGGYNYSEGSTNIYGNTINMYTHDYIYMQGKVRPSTLAWIPSANTVWDEVQLRLSGDVGTQSLSLITYKDGATVKYYSLIDANGNVSLTCNLSAANVYGTTSICVGNKRAWNDGIIGTRMEPGAITFSRADGGRVLFCWNTATTATSSIRETASGELTLTASNGVNVSSSLYTDYIRGLSATVSNAYINLTSTGAILFGGRATVPPSGDAGIRPDTDKGYTCGHSSFRWSAVYCSSSSNTTSDRTQKKDFRTFDSNENYEKLFMDLKPTIYKFIDGTSGRDHFGFISQDVEESLYKLGFDDKSFAGFCKDIRVDENENPVLDEDGNEQWIYSLRYEEFISLNTYMIQKLKAENTELRAEIEELKEAVNKLAIA